VTEPHSQTALKDLQLERLRASIHNTYQNTAYYRAKCEAAGVTPDDLRSLADLQRFPFTKKTDFREQYPFGMFATPREQAVRLHASSGTTGKPTIVGYTADDIAMWAGLVARSLAAAGARPGDILHNAYGYGLFTGGLGIHHGAEALGVTVIPASGGQTERQIQLITDLKPRIITATPSYMLALAEAFERQGLDPRASSLEIGVHGAEPWSEEMRREIEKRWNIQALDIYGLSEVMGPGVSMERLDARGPLTVWEDHFLPEIVDPDTGEPLPDGEEGELVFTSLTKQAVPIIRYRTGDLSRLSAPIGDRPYRRMDRILGRSDDMLIIRGVNLFPRQIEELILETAPLSPHYRIDITREGAMDALSVTVEPTTPNADCAEARIVLGRRIKDRLGVTAQILLVDCGAIPRSEGKAKRVYDHRKGS
jgi:phenylacetate-CoA ligase